MPPSQAPDECRESAGRVAPAVDRNRCEGSADCVRVCPYDVFEIGALSDADRAGLSLAGRIKAWVHGGRQAHVVRGSQCHACRRCIEACPEKALSLEPFAA